MYHLKTYLLTALILLSLNACGSGKTASAPVEPPPESTPESIEAMENEELTIVSVRLDEIRMTPKAGEREISLDNVWMIPVSLEQVDNARFQYVEGDNSITITQSTPYHPTSNWFISTERSELENQQFGMWFIVSGFDEEQNDLREQFLTFLDTAAPIAGNLALGATMLALPTPEEFLVVPAIVRGIPVLTRAISGSIQALSVGQSSVGQAATARALEEFSTALTGASTTTNGMTYFGEVLVVFPPAANYYLNNQIVIPTTDGSLEIVFSIFETTNATGNSDFTDQEPIETYTDLDSCDSSQLTSGAPARVVSEQLNAMQDPSPSSVDITFRAGQDDVLSPLVSYCHETNQTMWWLTFNTDGQGGWIPEENQLGERVIEVEQ